MADSNATKISDAPTNRRTTRHHEGDSAQDDPTYDDSGEKAPSVSRKEILKALEAVERDSAAIADSFSGLFSTLRSSLSQATSSTAEHMSCFSDAAGRVQESVLDASTKGNRYINSCLRLNEEMKGMDTLAAQLYPRSTFTLLYDLKNSRKTSYFSLASLLDIFLRWDV